MRYIGGAPAWWNCKLAATVSGRVGACKAEGRRAEGSLSDNSL